MIIRVLTAIMLVCLLLTPPSMVGSTISYPYPTKALIEAFPVRVLGRDQPANLAGKFSYIAGWSLKSHDPDFFGLSSLSATPLPNGSVAFVALSDRAQVIRFTLDGKGQLSSPSIKSIEERPVPLRFWGNRDTESLLHDPARNGWWVGYERQNQLWFYDEDMRHALRRVSLPGPFWSLNAGPEAMTMVADDRIVVFAEGKEDDGRSAVLLYPVSPLAQRAIPKVKWLYAPRGYAVTDATVVDQTLYLMLRDFDLVHGFRSMIAAAPISALESDIVRPHILADLSTYNIEDNFEGISGYREGKRTTIWIMSDNNANGLQRTLLLKFGLEN